MSKEDLLCQGSLEGLDHPSLPCCSCCVPGLAWLAALLHFLLCFPPSFPLGRPWVRKAQLFIW